MRTPIPEKIFNLLRDCVWKCGRRWGYLLARHRAATPVRLFATASECYLNSFKNRSYDSHHNGEDRVQSLLAFKDGDIVFDVGANVGKYTKRFLALHPGVVIHAFEIDPENSQKFLSMHGSDPRVHLHDTGLAEKAGEFVAYAREGGSQTTSLYDLGMGDRKFTARCMRGDKFCAQHGIEQVDFMKVDTEGHDLQVLKGFGEMLRPEKLRCIQFEYNETSVNARVFLADFFDLLQSRGYSLGKLYPRRVEFTPYDVRLEDHRASNYLAVAEGSALQGRMAGGYVWKEF